jgi:hypothetical protein
MPTTLAEWATVIGLPLVIIQTLYAALTFYNTKISEAAGNPPRTSYRHLVIMSVIALISWSLFAADQFMRKPETIFADAIVDAWGYHDGIFGVAVRGEPFLQFKKDHNIILYVKPSMPGADRMTDTHGIKSKEYTIREGTISVVVAINKEYVLC